MSPDEFMQGEAEASLPGDKVERQTAGNYDVITCTSKSIKTVPELLAAIDMPLDALDATGDSEWVVAESQATKWDTSAKIADEIYVVPLFRVYCKLRRRRVLPVEFEPLRPLNITFDLPPPVSTSGATSGLKRAVILPDAQFGFRRHSMTGVLDPLHDRLACDVATQIIADVQPHRIVSLGDMLDLPEWSDKFLHGPEFAATTKPAAIELAWWLARNALAAGPYLEQQDYIEGNHEFRLMRSVISNVSAAAGLTPINDLDGHDLLSVPRLLCLDQLGVTYHDGYPHNELWLNDNLRVSHGHIARQGSGDTVKAILAEARNSEIVGHIHRVELASKTTHPRRGAVSYCAFSPGTLARIDGAVPAAAPRVNWQQGLGVVEYEEGNGIFNITPIYIYGGRAIYNGKIYQGEFDVERLRRETGWAGF